MGNNCSSSPDSLRDYEEEVNIPSHLSRITSNMVMVNFQGNFLPCMILRESTKIPKGYGVYLFHIQEEIDVPARTILGNLKALMHCEVSFLDKNGLLSTGYVRSTDWRKNESGGPLNFFVCCKDTRDYIWVSFPYIFLNKEQSSVFCC